MLVEQHTQSYTEGEEGAERYQIIAMSTEKKMHNLKVENYVLLGGQN